MLLNKYVIIIFEYVPVFLVCAFDVDPIFKVGVCSSFADVVSA